MVKNTMNVKIVCVVLTAVLVLESEAGKIPHPKQINPYEQDANDENVQIEDLRVIAEGSSTSGSGVEIEASGVSGSGEEKEEQKESPKPPAQLPKGLPFQVGFKGPVTITPVEPNVNRQKPFYRPCFFCFPRGRLGRVEVTAPGGPYLMNGFGDGYPNMGMGPPQGPVFPGNMDFPEYGPGPAAGGPPCCNEDPPCCSDGPPCNCQGNMEDPMNFQEVSEGPPPSHPNPHPKVVSDMHTGHKAMAGHPHAQSIHKAVAMSPPHHKPAAGFYKNTNKALDHVTMKGAMDDPSNKPVAGKTQSLPSETKMEDKAKENKKPSGVEEWVHI